MLNHSMRLSRLAIGICGLVVGGYCAFTAFRNGQNFAGGVDGLVVGAAFAAVVVGSWFLLPLASVASGRRAIVTRAGWLLLVAFVLINAIGFTATHRSANVGLAAVAITGYDQALATLTTARAELDTMKANPRWTATTGCTNATAEKSVGFCGLVASRQQDVRTAQEAISRGKPATADAQADTIAWALQADAVTVSRAMPILMAVVLDIAASLFMFVALAPVGAQARPVIDITPIVEAMKVAPKPKTKALRKPAEKPLQMLSPPSMKVDMRTKKGREMKRIKAGAAND